MGPLQSSVWAFLVGLVAAAHCKFPDGLARDSANLGERSRKCSSVWDLVESRDYDWSDCTGGCNGCFFFFRLKAPRLHWLDVGMAVWVLIPSLTGMMNPSPMMDDILQSVYLGLVWGGPYVLGVLSTAHLKISMSAYG